MKSTMKALAIVASVLVLAHVAAAVPDFPFTPKGKVPPFTPNGTSGQWAILGSYVALPGGIGEGWRYSGFQLVGVNLTGGVDAWKYLWSFENPWQKNNGTDFWSSRVAQTFEIGYSSLYPKYAANPYVNAYVMNVTTGIWSCYHIPVPKHFTNDFLATSTASNGTINGQNAVPKKWGRYLGDGNLFVLSDGHWAGEVVRMYLNTDRWFVCPRCGVLTAMSVKNGLMLRQIYVQPTIDFYTDYYDYQVFDARSPGFAKTFEYPPFIAGTQCVDITNGQGSCYTQSGPRACRT